MRLRFPVIIVALVFMMGFQTWADQITLKDGTVYSGKFIRGDTRVVEFRILGKVESFRIENIQQITFKEPELETPAPAARVAPPPSPVQPETTLPATPTPAQQRDIKPAMAQETPPQTDPSSAITLPVGTPITVRTSTEIDTDRNRVGDAFDASLDQPLVYGNQTVAPRGTTVKGRIAYAKESGKISGQAQLVLELTEMFINGRTYFLRTADYTEVGSNRANRTAATVGGTAALGAIVGAIAGGGTGAAVGAASGAAVGTGVQVMTKGQTLRIPAETIIEFRLQSPMTLDLP
jgi:hypothetical protein